MSGGQHSGPMLSCFTCAAELRRREEKPSTTVLASPREACMHHHRRKLRHIYQRSYRCPTSVPSRNWLEHFLSITPLP